MVLFEFHTFVLITKIDIMDINCESRSFDEFLKKDISLEAFRQNANVGVVVGDKALFINNRSIMNYQVRNKQAFTIYTLLACCRSEGDALGFANTLCLVSLLNPSITKEEWMEELRQELSGEHDGRVAR